MENNKHTKNIGVWVVCVFIAVCLYYVYSEGNNNHKKSVINEFISEIIAAEEDLQDTSVNLRSDIDSGCVSMGDNYGEDNLCDNIKWILYLEGKETVAQSALDDCWLTCGLLYDDSGDLKNQLRNIETQANSRYNRALEIAKDSLYQYNLKCTNIIGTRHGMSARDNCLGFINTSLDGFEAYPFDAGKYDD